jgi:signal transduction histidine kinase
MGRWLSSHWQPILVGSLFVASLVALMVTGAGVFMLPHQELEARDRLSDAARELADDADSLVGELPPDAGADRTLPDAYDRRFAAVSAKVLARYPDFEGGFYVNGEIDQFAGYGGTSHSTAVEIPTGREADEKKLKAKKGSEKIAVPKPIPSVGRRDPPPLETPSIRQQAKSVLDASVGSPPLVEVRDVGPSRVAVATVAVGNERPSRLAAWVMVRLTDPTKQRDQLQGYLISATLALGGILCALALMVKLGRSLRREREQREQLRGELRKAEHLASLGGLLAGVAHEVRNPLAAIRSTVQLWERLPDQARTPASFAAVIAAVDRLNALVGRLLYFARSGHEERRSMDLSAIAAETLELSRAQAAEQGVGIETDFESGLPPVNVAPQAIQQVVLNLVSNALQAMPDGGQLTCRTRIKGESVELLIADTGPGVPMEVRDRLFEPFFTTRPEGTGLGLALCREIVAQHGGKIGLDTEARTGACFRISLPAARGDS